MGAPASVRLFSGESRRLPGQFCQFSNWRYVTDENGNDVISSNPQSSASGTTPLDVKLPGGDAIAKCR